MKEFQAIVFDTETTGLIKPDVSEMKDQPHIIEYFAYKLLHKADGTIETIDEFETFLKPPVQVSAEITKITGITNDDVKYAPSFQDKFQELAGFHLGVKRIVAHNLAFDIAMMANEISRIGKILKFPFPPEHICTVQKTRYIEQRRMTLSNLHIELFGHEFTGAHRARTDVDALTKCYIELVGRGKI